MASNLKSFSTVSLKRLKVLKEFIEEGMPWVHLDIAGSAYLDSPVDYHLTQATGAGVRLLNELLLSLK